MANATLNKFIGIKQVWYGLPMTSFSVSELKTWLKAETTTQVKNCHNGTFAFDETESQTTEYINELTGERYFIDIVEPGKSTVKWVSGEYTFEDQVELQGGTLVKEGDEVVGWASPVGVPEIINKAIVGKTKNGNYVIYTNAQITAKSEMAEKALGLGVTATAMGSGVDDVAAQYRLSGSAVDKV